MNFDSFWWAWQGQKICLACMPCIALCVENWPICHYANCTAILLLQMSFVTKNADIFDSFLEMHDRLPNIVWRKLLITLKKSGDFPFSVAKLFFLYCLIKKKNCRFFLANFKISSPPSTLQVPLNFMVKPLVFLFLAKWNWLSGSFHLKMIQ